MSRTSFSISTRTSGPNRGQGLLLLLYIEGWMHGNGQQQTFMIDTLEWKVTWTSTLVCSFKKADVFPLESNILDMLQHHAINCLHRAPARTWSLYYVHMGLLEADITLVALHKFFRSFPLLHLMEKDIFSRPGISSWNRIYLQGKRSSN